MATIKRFDDVWVPEAVALDIEFANLPIEIASLTPHLRILLMPTLLGFCPCEHVSENSRAACLRSLWMFQLPRQPRTRARRRQRRGRNGCKRGPPTDGDGDGPPRSGLCIAHKPSRFAGRRS